MAGKYTALIIDLKGSRKYTTDERNAIQEYILSIINMLNRMYKKYLIQMVDFSAGDEIQGLFSSIESAYQYYRMFQMWIHPVNIRAGIGNGDWEVQLKQKGTTGQDGSAYHHARYAINHTNDMEGYPVLLYSMERSDMIINTIIGAAASIILKQSTYQNQLMLIIELMFPIRNGIMIEYDNQIIDDMQQLLSMKRKMDHIAKKKTKVLPLDRLITPVKEWVFLGEIEEQKDKNVFYVTNGKQRGIPTKVANILGMSRQNVDKVLRNREIFTARNMTFAASSEMIYVQKGEND